MAPESAFLTSAFCLLPSALSIVRCYPVAPGRRNRTMAEFRRIPSIEQVLRRQPLRAMVLLHGHGAVADAARAAADELRVRFAASADVSGGSGDPADWIEQRAIGLLTDRIAPSLRHVVNATGVVIHTNLGRAPLAAEAMASALAIGSGYSNLEYDLQAGSRGHRHVHAERLLCHLTGAEAAVIVNNNAAATLLVLAALAASREVIVSRGELVEIGGGFRVPDVMVQSGARLREVGTTNRTRVNDYAAAINDRTGAILRVHPSNFRIEGFTERPALADLAALARRFSLPLVEDLGSGWLGLEPHPALGSEPSVAASVGDGADLVMFSGDKLLGGPQAGVIVGRRDLLDQVRRHPLMRALRADKLSYAALEATLAMWAMPAARERIPVYRMIALTVDDLDRRAREFMEKLATVPGLDCTVIDGVSTIGGGSVPGSALPTRLIAIEADALSASALEARLREGDPPVIARIQDDRVVIDLRTVSPEEEPDLLRAISGA